ncbi:unnamed protein product [Peniophora sp. CBMAI 1063]|nr:unnamed protein product [Peniophora sp. CBMAI 1063]
MPRGMAPKTSGKQGEPATKRVKTSKAATKPAVKTRLKQGRLSALPTLPLDVLYEVFAHLGPGDLISLARTGKNFRSMLLSRQSTFLWREVLAASVEEGYPPRPEDMTEPGWAGFFFGGSYCSLCAAKTTLEVCWAQRRRLCKACAEEKLLPVVKLADWELMSQETSWSDIISADNRRPLDKEGLNQYDRNSKIPHAYIGDIEDYETKLEELYAECEGDNERWELRRAEFDAERKEAVQARKAHARLCIKWEGTRASQRSRELGDTRRDRGKEIVKRLLALGYDRRDVVNYSIREHKDYKDARPLTDKIWTRIQPGLVATVEKHRANRLFMAKNERHHKRQEAIRIEYVDHVLRRVDHSVVPFLPPLEKIYKLFPEAEAVIEPDGEVTDDLRALIRQALPSGLPALQRFIDERGSSLRAKIPPEWLPSKEPRSAPVDPITTPEQLSISRITDLDRAVYVTRCANELSYGLRRKKHLPIHFGLDALAHFCDRSYEISEDALTSPRVNGFAFDQTCHDTVAHICALLGLDAAIATPLDLNKLDRAFVCINCPRDTRGAVFMTWHDAVAHADPHRRQAHTSKRPTFRLASDIEKRYLKAHLMRSGRGSLCDGVWGCTYCSDHLKLCNPGASWAFGSRDQFMSIDDARKHLQEKHNKSTAVEGEDIYFKRSETNSYRFVHALYEEKRERKRQLRTTDDVVLPTVDSEGALLALTVAKETLNEQQSAAAAANPHLMDWDSDGGSD